MPFPALQRLAVAGTVFDDGAFRRHRVDSAKATKIVGTKRRWQGAPTKTIQEEYSSQAQRRKRRDEAF